MAPALIDEIVSIDEVTDAESVAGDLFRRHFHAAPPNYGRHFVALYRAGRDGSQCIGYIHYSFFEDMYLIGGMVIDKGAYRRIPLLHRRVIRDAGGIAEKMLRDTMARCPGAPAFWGHVGDKLAYEVDYRVGFRPTGHPHVIVFWNREISEKEKIARTARVAALGPF